MQRNGDTWYSSSPGKYNPCLKCESERESKGVEGAGATIFERRAQRWKEKQLQYRALSREEANQRGEIPEFGRQEGRHRKRNRLGS
ncbi:hypothetical protein R1flu_007517 [Riccia fluitans]|uniref:Uncharacterized protein n=1 Tax=Riccia fluitans TaxID=41844 RepID=A0ABD1YZX1_9MARC